MRCQQQQYLSVCNRSCALGVVAVCAMKKFDLDCVDTSSTNIYKLYVQLYTKSNRHAEKRTLMKYECYVTIQVPQFDEGLWQQWPSPSTEICFWHITALYCI